MFIATKDGSYTIEHPIYKVYYHSRHGAYQESNHVFIKEALNYHVHINNSRDLDIFEMGFGTGFNALLTYKYASEKNININYDAIDNFPLENFDSLSYIKPIQELNANTSIFNIMHQAKWGLECTIEDFFKLTKYNQSIFDFSATNKFDIIYFDAFAPSAQPELWTVDIMDKMYNMLKKGGVLTTYCAKGQLKRNLKQVGFNVESIPGPLYKREMIRAIK